MEKCYLCPRYLEGENISEEHIILNSIAGKLTSEEIICRTCNSEYGDSCDKELSKQLAPLASLLMIKGRKKKIQDIKTTRVGTNEEITLKGGHKPLFSKLDFKVKKIDEKQSMISIRARDEDEMLQKLKELKAKYKDFDVEEAKQSIKHYSDTVGALSIEMTIGGKESLKSIVKTALHYYLHTRKDTVAVSHLFEYMKGNEELDICKHFYPNKSIYKKEPNEMVHILHLVGDKHSKQLYCYVEFFSTYSFIVKLSTNYQGQNFTETYCQDVLKNKFLTKDVKLKMKEIGMTNLFSYTKDEFENIRERFTRTRKIIDRVQNNHALDMYILNAIKNNFGEEGEIITDAMLKNFSNELSHEVAKMIVRKNIAT
jgi:hypothetical protein